MCPKKCLEGAVTNNLSGGRLVDFRELVAAKSHCEGSGLLDRRFPPFFES